MQLKGWELHREAVRRLSESYAHVPQGSPVRLQKKTSNLFRPRESSHGPGLDGSALDGVIDIDPTGRCADVQGMCTYEDLVDVTLAHGMIPKVVPQLRTITLGGAVTGLGIESTSFRNGLPHESVLEMDVFTGAGEVVTCTRENQHSELFWTFPNSYGSLGYATRLRIELEPVPAYVALRHIAFNDASELTEAIGRIVEAGKWDGVRVDGLDGVAFAPGEYYLSLAEFTDVGGQTSDYTGMAIFYRSIQQRPTDLLTMYDYLWRWDTDWFWCSRAFGVQNPWVRQVWPRRYKRSDVYHRLVRLDSKYGIIDRLDRRAGRPRREKVIQDVEVPLDQVPAFLDWFDNDVGMRPVWLCPLVAHDDWPSYPLRPHQTYVNIGFWGAVSVGDDAPNAPLNRAIEAKVHDLDGHKSLYSEAFYDADIFDALYNGANLAAVKKRYDPDARLINLYDKAVGRR